MAPRNLLKFLMVGVVALAGCVADQAGPGDDEESSVVQAVTSPPTNLAATINSCTKLTLTWDAYPTATKFILLQGTASGNETTLTSLPAGVYTWSNGRATPGATYSYQIKAVVGGVTSAVSNEVLVTMPSCGTINPPTGVTATASSSSRVNVSWTAVSGAQKYFVYRAVGAGTASLLSTTTATSYQDDNLTAATSYCYTVAVQTANGTSAQSTPAACATTFIAGLEGYWKMDERSGTSTADASGFGRNATFTGAAAWVTAGKAPIENNLASTSTPGGTGDALTVADNPVFWLSAGSNWSVSFWAQTPTAPTGTVYFIGKRVAGCGRVNWEIGQDTTNKLYFRSGNTYYSSGTTLPAGKWTHVAVTNTGTSLTFYVNGAQVATGTYAAATRATDPMQFGNSGGCGNAGAVYLDEVKFYSRALAANEVSAIGARPAIPTGLTATVNSSTKITVNWGAVAGATKYLVYQGTTSGGETFLTSNTPNSYANGHLNPSTTYYWKIATVGGGLISDLSAEVSATTNAGPAAPTGVTATAISSSRINVSWTAVTGAAKYYVYQSTDGTNFTLKGSVTTTSLGATGLTTMTKYYYKVVAEDAGLARSADSAIVNATTL